VWKSWKNWPIVSLVLVVTVDLVATYLDLEDGQELERWSITTWNNSFSLSRRRPAPLLFFCLSHQLSWICSSSIAWEPSPPLEEGFAFRESRTNNREVSSRFCLAENISRINYRRPIPNLRWQIWQKGLQKYKVRRKRKLTLLPADNSPLSAIMRVRFVIRIAGDKLEEEREGMRGNPSGNRWWGLEVGLYLYWPRSEWTSPWRYVSSLLFLMSSSSMNEWIYFQDINTQFESNNPSNLARNSPKCENNLDNYRPPLRGFVEIHSF